ncbi:MAG: hypothetical protein ACI8UX_001319, partial [Psychromonas sp.]
DFAEGIVILKIVDNERDMEAMKSVIIYVQCP